MPHWSPLRGRRTGEWLGASVFVLAVCLGVGWATALIMSASSRTPPITDSTKDLLSTVGGGLVGVIGAYIGGALTLARQRQKPPEEPPPPEEPLEMD